MAVYEVNLGLNNGGSVVVSTLAQDFFTPKDSLEALYSFTPEECAQAPTSVDLRPYLPQNATPITTELIQAVCGATSTPLTPAEEESEAYQTAKATFLNNVHWIWGSFDDGGCFAYKRSANTYDIGTISGIYERSVAGTTAKFYDYKVLGANFTYDYLRDVIFIVYQSEIYDSYGRLELHMLVNEWSSLGYSVVTSDLIQWLEDLITTPFYDTPVAHYSWTQVMQKYGMVDPIGGAPRPIRIFRNYADYGLYSFANLSQWEYVSGDWSGGMITDIDDGGNSGTGGGNGDFNNNSDDVDTSDGNNITNDVLLSGFVTLFRPTLQNLRDFNDFLFTDITDSIAEQLKRLQTNPLDYVVSISMCHFTPPSTLNGTIKFAGISSGVTAPLISKQFVTLNCGSINVHEYFGNFLDYNPYTHADMYLPYIGIVPIDVNDIMGQPCTVKVVYTIDLLTGSCIAQIKCTRSKRTSNDSYINSVLYEFQGNCFVNIPLSATDWHGAYNSIIQGVNAIGSAIGGNVAGAVSQSASAVISQKVTAQRTGSLQPSHGFMGKQYPYLILSRPIQNMPYNYKGFEGYTSNIRYKVKDLIGKGYTEIDQNTIWTDNFGHATAEECDMIKDIMNGGVYL